MDLRRVEGHRQDPVDLARRDEVGDEAATEGDARGVLLVRTGIRKVRDDGGDLVALAPLAASIIMSSSMSDFCVGGAIGWTI